jgi:hypothetical protein
MTNPSADAADRLNYLKTCEEFVSRSSCGPSVDADGPVYLELVEIVSRESLGLVFPNGFMTAVKCLEASATFPKRATSPRLRAQMRELAARLHDGRCGYRFFQDSRRYPEDVDSTSLLNAALHVTGELPAPARELAKNRILASRLDDNGFSVWLMDGTTTRPQIRDAVVDMNAFGALALLSGGEPEFRNSFQNAAIKAVTACEAGNSVYYNHAGFVRELRALWARLLGLGNNRGRTVSIIDKFRGQVLAQHRDGAVGYLIC